MLPVGYVFIIIRSCAENNEVICCSVLISLNGLDYHLHSFTFLEKGLRIWVSFCNPQLKSLTKINKGRVICYVVHKFRIGEYSQGEINDNVLAIVSLKDRETPDNVLESGNGLPNTGDRLSGVWTVDEVSFCVRHALYSLLQYMHLYIKGSER